MTSDTLDQLEPRGSDLSKDAQVIRIGNDVARPSGFKTAVVEGDDAFERAAAVDRFFSAARGRPSENVVLYSGEEAEWAMPAAAWAARSGDAALPVERDSVPEPIRKALREHDRPNVYVLGPERVVSNRVVAQLEKGLAGSVNRVAGPTPVENAIAFARYRQGDFGWGVEVPGYNFSVASTAAAARRRRGRVARHPRRVRPAAADRPRRRSAAGARELLPQRPAGLRGRPRAGRVQPRLDPGRRQHDLAPRPGAARPDHRADPRSGAPRPDGSRLRG